MSLNSDQDSQPEYNFLLYQIIQIYYWSLTLVIVLRLLSARSAHRIRNFVTENREMDKGLYGVNLTLHKY
jgi:hypothetical protein